MAKSNMDQDILKVLYSEEQLKTRVQEMGDELYERLKGKNPLFLGVLKGSFIFMADIVRACQLKSDIEFIAVSSYQNATTSSGVVQITRDLQQDITGRDIVVIEDILDSGNTLYFLKNYFMTKGASSVTVVTLLDKPVVDALVERYDALSAYDKTKIERWEDVVKTQTKLDNLLRAIWIGAALCVAAAALALLLVRRVRRRRRRRAEEMEALAALYADEDDRTEGGG